MLMLLRYLTHDVDYTAMEKLLQLRDYSSGNTANTADSTSQQHTYIALKPLPQAHLDVQYAYSIATTTIL